MFFVNNPSILAWKLILLVFFICPQGLLAQITFTKNNITVKVTGLPSAVCGNKYGQLRGSIKPGSRNPPRLTQYISPVDNVPFAEHVLLKSQTSYTIKFEVSPKSVVLDTFSGELLLERNIVYGGVWYFSESQKRMRLIKRNETSTSIVYEAVGVQFFNGTEKGYISLAYRDGEFVEYVIVPVFVEGISDEMVPVTDTTVQPKIPFMILHPPPGDGSTCELVKNKTICRGLEDTYATAQSNDVHGTIKLGVAGSAGFIVTTNFEFSVAFSAGLKIESSQVGTNNSQTCITNTSTYTASGSDLFIGYGTDMVLGKFKWLSLNRENCTPKYEERLISAPIGTAREFALTKDEILLEIDSLQKFLASSTKDNVTLRSEKVRAINNAQNQIDVWNQVLQFNETNVNDPQNKVHTTFKLSGPNSRTETAGVTVVDTRSITYEQFIEGRAGLEVVVEVAGSGFTGGYEFTSSKRFGVTENASSEETKQISYTIADDDPGDVISVDISTDPMFGSPIFRLKPEDTKSSCPYEGGTQLDNPQLKVPNSTADSLVVTGVRVGGDAIFTIQVCNNSTENRSYNLRLDDNTNSVLNAQVIAGGDQINNNPNGRVFNNMKPGCTNAEIIVRQTNKSRLNYPRLKLDFSPSCPDEGEISSSIYLSAYFDPATGVHESLVFNSFDIYPNPTQGATTVDFILPQSQRMNLQVMDVLGRLVYTHEFKSTDHLQHLLPSGAWSTGMYVINIKTPVGSANKKLFVNR